MNDAQVIGQNTESVSSSGVDRFALQIGQGLAESQNNLRNTVISVICKREIAPEASGQQGGGTFLDLGVSMLR